MQRVRKVYRIELMAVLPSERNNATAFGPSLELGVEWFMAPFLTPEQLEKLREDLKLTPRRYLLLRMEDGRPQAWWPDLAYREPSRRR